jgi:signal transduction histidine kinase
MSAIGLVIALFCLFHVKHRMLESHRRRGRAPLHGAPCGSSWHDEWHRQWGGKWQKQADRRRRELERHARRFRQRVEREARRYGLDQHPSRPGLDGLWKGWDDFWSGLGVAPDEPGATAPAAGTAAHTAAATADEKTADATTDDEVLQKARRRAQHEFGFYIHLVSYLASVAIMALINLLTTPFPWFIFPTLGWGIGVFSHYVAVFGSRYLKERVFDPMVAREVQQQKTVLQTEKRASIDELSSTLAHEIRNPIAAARSLVQQMGEDPTSLENVEYAKVALEEMERVERSISHLLKYAKEEDYQFAPVSIASVVDAALTELRAKLDGAKVSVSRNYIGGPTLVADREKLRQVFANIVDNAIDAFDGVADGRRIDLFIENGNGAATVRVRDNGCGIPADKLEKIFNPFFTTKAKGTGLGMAITKKIVEAHAGTIDVLSEPGRGTEFVVALPMSR